jgi:hypothetical protein
MDWDRIVIRSRFVMEDLTLYPPHEVAILPSIPIENEEALNESANGMSKILYLPRCLRTENLTNLLRRSRVDQGSLGKSTCVVCGQDLAEFYLSVVLEEVQSRGWCPRHLLHLEWKMEWRTLDRDLSSARPSLEDFIREKEEQEVQRMNHEDFLWWKEQVEQETPLYLEYSRRMGNIRQNTGSVG